MRKKKGTPAQRQFSISALQGDEGLGSALGPFFLGVGRHGCSVADAFAVLAADAHLLGDRVRQRRSDLRTLTFSSRTESAPASAGGSMATRQRSWSIWFWTMSRRAPYSS